MSKLFKECISWNRNSNFILFLFLVIPLVASLAMAANPGTEKKVQYLSGTDSKHTKTWDFYCTGGRKSGYWTNIEVPSCWEQQGFGAYNFGRDNFTYGSKFKYADEKGMYRHSFKVPNSWKGQEIYLVFEGSMTDTEVKINGKQAGAIHQGAFYQFRYNVTDKLLFGKDNKIEVTVSKMSADESVNRAERLADYWIFGGIFRPVYLEAFPKEFLERTAIVAKADGSFAMDVYPKGLTANREISAEILDAQGEVVGKGSATAGQKDEKVTLKCQVVNPRTWTSETPALYRVNVSLKTGQQTLYQTSEKFGFRTIEIRRGDGIYINGTKVKMKGTNRHAFWPETGRTLNPDIDLMDVKLLKEMNMNAVRCSHYPPDQSFLSLCDSLGLYVLDELAGWQKAYDTPVGEKLVRELVLRDVNHPSIIFWSNGNEGGTNKELDDDYLRYDPSQRPVIHAHHKPGNDFNGIDCNHYEDYYSMQKILSDSLIYMPTEFLHCQDDGGCGAGLSDFWELMWKSPKSAGSFLWAFVDEGVVRTDKNGFIDANAVNAPDGVLGPHRQKEGSFFAMREIFSPVVISLKELPASFNGEIPLENRYHFTNLNQCTFRWKLADYRLPYDRLPGHIATKETSVAGPSVAPLASGSLRIQLPADWKNHDAMMLSAFDPAGNEIYQWVWKIKGPEADLTKVFTRKNEGSVDATETDSILTLKANGISVTFNKQDGTIKELANDNSMKLSFKNGPILCNGNASVSSFKHAKDKEGYVVDVQYTGEMKWAHWKMTGNGWLILDYEYAAKGKYSFSGISFTYPEMQVIGAKWLGNGPYRVWKNRPQGVRRDVWEALYNNTQTGYYPWFYPEFKGYYSDVSWLELNTVEGKLLIASKEKDLYVRLFDFYALVGARPHPTLPPGDISFLDRIPPTGTKMAANINSQPGKLGPLSQPNEGDQTFKRTLYFYFGLPEQ